MYSMYVYACLPCLGKSILVTLHPHKGYADGCCCVQLSYFLRVDVYKASAQLCAGVGRFKITTQVLPCVHKETYYSCVYVHYTTLP